MARLTAYLVRKFFANALAFAAVFSVLIWLIQCLRVFDVVSVKGQNLLTLFGQSLLTMPSVLVVFLYVCFGIGLGRSLRDLQGSHELHAIHAGRRLPALLRAVALYGAGAAAVVLVLSNFVDPWATHRLNIWQETIAADLVSRTLVPHRFSEVVPGVVILIGGRHGNGEITDFFADDRRDPAVRRTYIAKNATISSDGADGYILNLRDGSLQYQSAELELSQVAFKRYNIAMDRLTDPIEDKTSSAEMTSFELVAQALQTGKWDNSLRNRLASRVSEGLRVFAMALLVASLAMFPDARRPRFRMPLEVLILVLAFVERGLTNYIPAAPSMAPFTGAAILLGVALTILAWRLRLFRPRPRRVRAKALAAAQVPA